MRTDSTSRLPADVDPTKVSLAYGDRALPKLNRELRGADLLSRQRAIMALCTLLHNPEYIVEALNNGIDATLTDLLSDEDDCMRQKSTEAWYILCGHAVGRIAFVKNMSVVPLSNLFEDPLAIVRKNAHQAVYMSTTSAEGAENVVRALLVPKLVRRLKEEVDEIKVLILSTLYNCIRFDPIPALCNDSMEVFTDLLSHSNPTLREHAANNIMVLSIPFEGKKYACKANATPMLIALLEDPNADVRSSAAGALMSITIAKDGKYDAIASGGIEALMKTIEDNDSRVKLNTIKAITNLAEAPDGRVALSCLVPQLKDIIEKSSSDLLVRSAKIAVDVLTWKP